MIAVLRALEQGEDLETGPFAVTALSLTEA
jgi:hypothetical protein